MAKNKCYISFMVVLFSVLVMANMSNACFYKGGLKNSNDTGHIIAFCVTLNILSVGAVQEKIIANTMVFSSLSVLLLYFVLRFAM